MKRLRDLPYEVRPSPPKGKRACTTRANQQTGSKNVRHATKLQRPKEPVGKPWPIRDLRAFEVGGEVSWGPLLKDVLVERGWKLAAPCHSTNGDDSNHTFTYGVEDDGVTTVFMKEFEACLRGLKPEKAFGQHGVIEEGYRLRAVPLPKRALWMMSYASYRLPGPTNGIGRCFFREDFVRTLVEHGTNLSGENGNYRMCKFPGMETALFKTNFSEAFKEMHWYPRAYVLPKEKDLLLQEMKAGGESRSNYWIAKPRNDYAGSGISVWQGTSPELNKIVRESEGKPRSLVQRYLADPLLMGGYKFHMRIHLVITSLDPPEGFVQENGQCLFATKPYTLSKKTLGTCFDPPVHVTNMGLNATPENKDGFLKEKPVIGKGQQLRMAELEKHLSENHPAYNKQELWGQIIRIAAETVRYIAKAPSVRRHGRLMPDRHFEILGMDLMLDRNLKVYMCEVNGDPGLDYPDDEVLGSPNPDYNKEASACSETWHDLFSLMGLDAGKKHTKGSLKSWYKVDFSKADGRA